jgi:hypothetical protein
MQVPVVVLPCKELETKDALSACARLFCPRATIAFATALQPTLVFLVIAIQNSSSLKIKRHLIADKVSSSDESHRGYRLT